MEPVSLAEIRKIQCVCCGKTAGQLADSGVSHMVDLQQRCHPEHGLKAELTGEGTVLLTCFICEADVVSFMVGDPADAVTRHG